MYSGLQFRNVDLLLLTNLARLHNWFKVIALLAYHTNRKITFFVNINTFFTETASFNRRWSILLLRPIIKKIFNNGHLFIAVNFVVVVLSRWCLIIIRNLDLRHRIFIQNDFGLNVIFIHHLSVRFCDTMKYFTC